MEIDSDGEIVYRTRNGTQVENPEQTTALVSVLDPIPNNRQGRVEPAALSQQPTPPGGFPVQPGPPTPSGGFGPQNQYHYPGQRDQQSW
jgi:hypothetical protein